MKFLQKLKTDVVIGAQGLTGCATCPPTTKGAHGCGCDFLDLESPSAADKQAQQQKKTR